MAVAEKKPADFGFLSFIKLGIGILGVLYLILIVSRLVYPFGAGALEAFNWIPATHLAEGRNPFSFSFEPPYSMLPYGIVFYLLMALGVKFFGFQMWFGRILSVSAFAFCVFFVARIIKKTTHHKESVLIAVLAALAMIPAQTWIAVMRPDLIGASFGLAALWLVFELQENRRTNFLMFLPVVLFLTSAFFTKQSFLLPIGIVFLRFLQLNKWREAVLSAISVVALTVLTMFVLNETSGGGYFWQHFTHARTLPFDLRQSVTILVEMLKQPSFTISIILLCVFIFLNRPLIKNLRRDEIIRFLRSPKTLLMFYVVLSFFWAFVLTGRLGGYLNYYLENSFALSLAVGLIYDNFRRNSRPKLMAAMIVLLTLSGIFQMARVFRGEYFRWQSLSYYEEIQQVSAQFIKPGDVCVSVNPEIVMRQNCVLNFDDYEEYSGDWSPELREIFEREIKQNRYSVIIWYDDKLHLKFPNYRLVPMSQDIPERYFPIFLYVRETQAK